MKQHLQLNDVAVIPNGIDLKKFKPLEKKMALKHTMFSKTKNIIFVANPGRPEKNFKLAKEAVDKLDNPNIQLHPVNNISHDDLVFYYNAADVLILTSLWEGSPNVIKEAMACNCPIVSTDVGDVKNLIDTTEGCFLTAFDVYDVAEKLDLAIKFNRRTQGREAIKLLDSNIIAEQLIQLYNSVLS
jgi:glycosyltransferase involved in cell wall biosynthesis